MDLQNVPTWGKLTRRNQLQVPTQDLVLISTCITNSSNLQVFQLISRYLLGVSEHSSGLLGVSEHSSERQLAPCRASAIDALARTAIPLPY